MPIIRVDDSTVVLNWITNHITCQLPDELVNPELHRLVLTRTGRPFDPIGDQVYHRYQGRSGRLGRPGRPILLKTMETE